MFLAASAIRSEGEHNDVLRHFVREIRAPNGTLLGWIGAAYDVSPAIGPRMSDGSSSYWPGCSLSGCIGSPCLFGSGWTPAIAAIGRGLRAMFVMIGNFVALMAYILTRPKSS